MKLIPEPMSPTLISDGYYIGTDVRTNKKICSICGKLKFLRYNTEHGKACNVCGKRSRYKKKKDYNWGEWF